MKTYDVTIRCTITKTIQVEAKDQSDAQSMAHERFSINVDKYDEDYEQDTLSIKEVTT